MKLAIIGTGKIVTEALFAASHVKEIEMTAIFGRPHSRQKAVDMAARYGIGAVYTDYGELLSEADIDAVYIGLVNSVHYSYARKALEAGKHVILEKPFTSTAREAQDLVRLAREKDLFILEAITTVHGPVFEKLQEMLPRIGALKIHQGNFSQYSSRYGDYLKGNAAPAFDPALSGGALYDINLYNIYVAAALYGKPEKSCYFPNLGFNGVDTSGTAVLTYPGFQAVLTGAKDSDSPCQTVIQGEKGWIRIPGKPNNPEGLEMEYWDEDGPDVLSSSGGRDRAMIRDQYSAPPCPHRMVPEFEAFARIIDTEDREAAERCSQASLCVMEILEETRKSAGIRFGVDG